MSLHDLSSAPSGSDFEPSPSVSPTVSKGQWANHALRKLHEGYVLLQHPSGKVFHFYRAGEPMTPCAPHAAKRLLAVGMLTVTKSDVRGTHYTLREPFQAEPGAAA